MKTKLTWLLYVPATIFAVAVKVLQCINFQFPIDDYLVSYVAIAPAILVFLVNFIIVVIDRKISPVYLMKSNVPATIFSLLIATFIASKSILDLINILVNSYNNDYLLLLISVIGIVAAFSLVLIALAHSQGHNYKPKISACLLTLPLWACLMLIYNFMESRTHSIFEIDPSVIFIYIFAMMYFLNLSMLIATVDGKKPTKNCFLYGMPLSILCLCYGVDTAFSIYNNSLDYSENVIGFAFVSLAVYITIFNIELTKNAKSVDQQEVLFDIEDEEKFEATFMGNSADDFLIADSEDADVIDNMAGDYSDYITEVTPKTNDYADKLDANYDDEVLLAEENKYATDEAIYVSKYFAEEFESNIISDDNSDLEK